MLLRPLRATPLEVSMPGKLGLPEILLILAVALLIFGPSKLADLGKGLGEGAHAVHEHILISELPRRALLLAVMIETA